MLPPDVQLLPSGDTTRIILPRRQASGPRAAGCVPILFGLVFAGFAVFWILGAAGILDGRAPALPAGPEGPPLPPAERAFDWTSLLFALFGIPFFIAGCVPIVLGIAALLPSNAEIVMTAGELISVNHIGPFRIRRRRAIGQIARLRVGILYEKYVGTKAAAENHALYAESGEPEGGPLRLPLRLAPRYTVEMLTPVAQLVLSELQRRGVTAAAFSPAHVAQAPIALAIDPEPAPAPASDAGSEAAAEEPEVPQPQTSKIIFIPEPDSLTFIVGRTGFRGTVRFFLLFSLFWNGMAFPFFGMMLLYLIHEPSLENLGMLGFLSIFVGVGIATALAAIQSAFRKSVLLATRDSLVLTQTGPIRESEFQWKAGELTAIRAGNSNTTMNGKVLQELQIVSKDNPARSAFVGRDDDELLWLAAVLRRFYQVKSA